MAFSTHSTIQSKFKGINVGIGSIVANYSRIKRKRRPALPRVMFVVMKRQKGLGVS